MSTDLLGSSLGAGSTSYDPSAVQTEIDKFFAGHKGNLTEYESFFIMYLMQEYGAQVAGNDANLQGHMNKYFTKIQALWNTLYAADNSGASGLTGGPGSASYFDGQVADIEQDLRGDTFFNTPGREQMQLNMERTLQAIQGVVDGATGSAPNNLYNLWAQYDPSLSGSTGQGDPANMDNLMRQLGQLNQQFTGESQAVAADTKSDVQMWQTEQDSFNNWAKALNKCIMYMDQQQRTQ